MKALNDIGLSDVERVALGQACEALRANLPVARIILFGSKARGDSHPDSDIDLLVLTERALTREEERLAIDVLYDLELKHDVLFNSLEIPVESWEQGVYQALPLRTEIDRDGVIV